MNLRADLRAPTSERRPPSGSLSYYVFHYSETFINHALSNKLRQLLDSLALHRLRERKKLHESWQIRACFFFYGRFKNEKDNLQ